MTNMTNIKKNTYTHNKGQKQRTKAKYKQQATLPSLPEREKIQQSRLTWWNELHVPPWVISSDGYRW